MKPSVRPGACYWFTGLSGAGKTTISSIFAELLLEQRRSAIVLDGDVFRAGLCSDLGFSRTDRAENGRRAAEVAKLACAHFDVVLVTTISPYNADRERAREIVAPARFVEVHVSTSLEVCIGRDTKGLYGQAARGLILNLTGYNDVYEEPACPDLRLDTTKMSAREAAGLLLSHYCEMSARKGSGSV